MIPAVRRTHNPIVDANRAPSASLASHSTGSEDLLPNALLFPGLSRWTASDKHRATLEALELRTEGKKSGYTLHDARHHWAVRAIRSGWPIELVARQLGHADGTLALKVYGGSSRLVTSAEGGRRLQRKTMNGVVSPVVSQNQTEHNGWKGKGVSGYR